MDVLVEGKITPEEPMADVIETVIRLKNYPHLVLRITSSDSELEGRISCCRGSHILGGRINNSDEAGYKAIFQLLSVRDGNYAILDPGDQSIADINQTLWIVSERVKDSLPDLPASPMDLLDATKELQAINTESRVFYTATLPSPSQDAESERSSKLSRPESTDSRLTKSSNLKDLARLSRQRESKFGNFAQTAVLVVFSLAIGAALAMAIVKYWIFSTSDSLSSPAPSSPHLALPHAASPHLPPPHPPSPHLPAPEVASPTMSSPKLPPRK